jgi:menaquinone-dependent protoporphyrinogen oxidase
MRKWPTVKPLICVVYSRYTPVAYFVVCFTMNEDTPQNRETARGYLKPLQAAAPQVEPVDVGLFAGAVLAEGEDYRRLFPLMKIPVKAMAQSEGDHRDWDAIRAWAEQLSAKLIKS